MPSDPIPRDAPDSATVYWQAETGCSQKTTSSPAIESTLEIPPSTNATPVSGLENHLPPYVDHTGQVAPQGTKPEVTTTLWEDEGCLCFLVEVRGICVARREDNHMINGTKLLNVAGLTRSRRDSILKSEKSRHVVRTAPMHFKGVWISFGRALEIANREKITELLYPLFLYDIGSFMRCPSTREGIIRPESELEPLQTTKLSKCNDEYAHRIEIMKNEDKSLRRFPLDVVRNYELHEQGPIGSLYRSLVETLGLILIEVRAQSHMEHHYDSLEKSCAALFFWGTDLGLWRGELDNLLQDSPQLRNTCLAVLVSICQFVSTSLIQMISSEHHQKEVLQSSGISTFLEQTVNMIEEQNHSAYPPEQDTATLCQTLRTKIDTLIMLAPSLASPAEESFDDEEPRAIQDIKEHLPEQVYASSISQKFPLAASAIVTRLGKLNWDRYNHMLRLQRETTQQELQTKALEKARTMFHDSGLGVSLPTKSEIGLKIAESAYAPSVVSSRAEASHKRVPPLPAHARAGEPFMCEICNKQVRFRRTKAWKKHVFDDILAYGCFFAECCNTQAFFENSEALMDHLQDHHGMDVRASDVTCPLCVEFTSGNRDELSLHIARHMEEVALAVLPSGVESDEESVDDSTSGAGSEQDYNNGFRESETKLKEMLANKEKVLGSEHPQTLHIMGDLASLLGSVGKYEEAEAKFRRALKGCEEALGSEHPQTLHIMGDLAWLLSKNGKEEVAEAMYRQALAKSEKVLGSNHRNTLYAMSNFALFLGNVGKYEEAEAKFRRVLKGYEEVLGSDHPKTLLTRNSLSLLLSKMGKEEEAKVMHELSLPNSNSTSSTQKPDSKARDVEDRANVFTAWQHMRTLNDAARHNTANAHSSAASSDAGEQNYQEAESEVEAEIGPEEDSDEPRYCHCNKVAYGNMIACDNDDCSREWFHLECVALEKPPPSQTKWFCSDYCEAKARIVEEKRERRTRRKKNQGKGFSESESPLKVQNEPTPPTYNSNTNNNDDKMGTMAADDLDDLFNMDEYANPEQSSFDDAFFNFE